jgi:predicted O-methyltransferase YrrM
VNTFNGAPTSPFTGVPGWETIAEQEALLAAAALVPEGGTIVEIGAEFGMSASLFCKVARANVRIFSIDLFPGDLMYVHQANLQAARLAGRSKQIKGDSSQVGRAWQIGAVDLLFIDGDHSYEGVKRDIAAWIPHVKPGGTVIFHDAAPDTNKQPHLLHHEVHRAIDEWLEQAAPVETTYDLVPPSPWIEQPSVDTMRIFVRES